MRTLIFSFCFFLFTASSFAASKIAFLEAYDKNGQRVEYEPGGRFVHTAIQFPELGDKWLNAYPGEGVAVIDLETLQNRGVITEIVEIPQTLTLKDVAPYWGRSFDFWYSWSDEYIYCSELIGKMLGIPTHPMVFNKKFWPKNYWHLDGTPGLSPDTVYRWSLEQAQN